MDTLYLNLELDVSHPAIDRQDIPVASRAIYLYERGRDTFIDKSADRQEAYRALESATEDAKKFLDLRLGHRFIIERILLQNSPPKLHQQIRTGGERLEFGYRLASSEKTISNKKCRSVTLEHGLHGWECLLKANKEKKHFHLDHHYTADILFHARATSTESELDNEYHPGFLATIVGFSLSCNNKSAKFTITTGGILSSTLSVQVSAPYGVGWHCRIFFVEDKFGGLASHMD